MDRLSGPHSGLQRSVHPNLEASLALQREAQAGRPRSAAAAAARCVAFKHLADRGPSQAGGASVETTGNNHTGRFPDPSVKVK